MSRIVFLILGILVYPFWLSAETEPAAAAIAREMKSQGIPGISAAVLRHGRLVWVRGFGLADVENGVPVTPATVFRLASVSKTLTAVSALQLAYAGKLDLDAPVQKYCPSFPAKPWPVTSRELLGHLAGIRHYSPAEYETTSTRHYSDIVTPLAIFKDDPLLFPPGSRFSYSTYGFNLLGCVIEGASGDTYFNYVRAHVSGPSEMSDLRLDDAWALIPHRAQGYARSPDGSLRNSGLADTSNKVPGGGLCATATDLARFAGALQEGKLLPPAAISAMTAVQKTTSGVETSYGLGWELATTDGQKEVYHRGEQERVSTILYTLPARELAVVLLTNLEEANLLGLAREIARQP